MLFTHDTDLTLRAASVLVNSDRAGPDLLADHAALDGYLGRYGWTGRRDRYPAEIAAVHRLRVRLGLIWAAAAWAVTFPGATWSLAILFRRAAVRDDTIGA